MWRDDCPHLDQCGTPTLRAPAQSGTVAPVVSAILLALCLLLTGCGSAGFKAEPAAIAPDYASEPAASGLLADLSRDITTRHGHTMSGFSILDGSEDGLRWRLALIDSAVSSLDIQTYLWYPDHSGRLLLERVVLAAGRGVRVRMIVDDLLLQGLDDLLVNLENQPNIEFRIFNPWRNRGSLLERGGEMIAEMERLNTRMHDKLLIADGHAAVVGGRNLGDHYFGISSVYNFHDTDLLGFGHVGRQANAMFDHFWNSEWVVSARNLAAEPDAARAQQQWESIQAHNRSGEELNAFPREPKDWSAELQAVAAHLYPGRSVLAYDEVGSEGVGEEMLSSMFNFFRMAQQELLIMNAYVIPSQPAIDFMQELQDRGVEVSILTNSLASHDVPAVNSHYEPWRDDFLRAGVALYELRADPAIANLVDVPPNRGEFTGLHSKTAVVDRRYVFIGSMNLDPRSARINTELGAFVDSPGLAAEMARIIERNMLPENAWRVRIDANDQVFWQNSEETVYQQPARDGLQRVMNVLLKVVPKEQY
jgi:putative cardiolipin synthase